MDEVPQIRDAVRKTVRDVEPAPFRDRIERTLEGRPLTPGVLTVRTARAADGTIGVDTAADRAAGVQLTYEGLRLTGQLIDADPWASTVAGTAERGVDADDGQGSDARTDADGAGEQLAESADSYSADDADVDVVAAEVLVARGLDELAHTGVRERVVEIVRRFARIRSQDKAPADPPLESDFVVLAVAAGVDLAVQTVPPGMVEYARELAVALEADPLGGANGDRALATLGDDVERILSTSEPSAEDRSRSSTMDP